MDREAPKERGPRAQLHKLGRRWQLTHTQMPEAPLPLPGPTAAAAEGAKVRSAAARALCKPTAARARLSPPPSFLPTSPATPANLPRTPGRKKRQGKARPPGLQPQRETTRGKTNLGPGLREEWGARSRGRRAPPVPPPLREPPSPPL